MPAVNVYEFRNETLKEACVLKSPLPLEELRRALEGGKESRLAHWRWGEHNILASDVELSLPASAAEEFIAEYQRTITPQPGWRCV